MLERDLCPGAPKSGAEPKPVGETPRTAQQRAPVDDAHVEKMVERLKGELEPRVREVTARAAAQMTAREFERTRESFETKAPPKAVRVAQRETYDLLRKHGGVGARQKMQGVGPDVGRAACVQPPPAARTLTREEVRETAEVCARSSKLRARRLRRRSPTSVRRGAGGCRRRTFRACARRR